MSYFYRSYGSNARISPETSKGLDDVCVTSVNARATSAVGGIHLRPKTYIVGTGKH